MRVLALHDSPHSYAILAFHSHSPFIRTPTQEQLQDCQWQDCSKLRTISFLSQIAILLLYSPAAYTRRVSCPGRSAGVIRAHKSRVCTALAPDSDARRDQRRTTLCDPFSACPSQHPCLCNQSIHINKIVLISHHSMQRKLDIHI